MKYIYFIMGYIFYSNILGFIQDSWGQEKYIKFIKDKWVDSKISKPIHFITIVIISIAIILLQ